MTDKDTIYSTVVSVKLIQYHIIHIIQYISQTCFIIGSSTLYQKVNNNYYLDIEEKL